MSFNPMSSASRGLFGVLAVRDGSLDEATIIQLEEMENSVGSNIPYPRKAFSRSDWLPELFPPPNSTMVREM